MFDLQGSSHLPHSIDAGGKIKTERESEESLYFLDLLCDSRALFFSHLKPQRILDWQKVFIPVTKGLRPPI